MIGDAVRWTRSVVTSDKSTNNFQDSYCYSMAAVFRDTPNNRSRLNRCDRDEMRNTSTNSSQSRCSNDREEKNQQSQSIVLSSSSSSSSPALVVHHYQYHQNRDECGSQDHLLQLQQRQNSRSQKPGKRRSLPTPPRFLSFSCQRLVVVLQSVLVNLVCAMQFCLTQVVMASSVGMSKTLTAVSRRSPYKFGSSSSNGGGFSARSFARFFLVFLQVYALSTSFVIGSSVQASNDFSTSWDMKSSGDAESSVLDFDSDSGNGASDSVIGHYTPTWAVHIPDGDVNGKADEVAQEHGFINLGKIFDDHYHFHHNSVRKRSIDASHHHQRRLEDDHRVQWSRQQQIKSRQKRDFIRMRPARTSSVSRVELNDPKWPQMWYLNRGNGLDMNVIPAWEQGITGKGVVVTILDDGLESDHPDLEHNYDPKASYDVNSHDDDPMPHYDMTDSNRHGTRCAGEVAATANNSLCSVGIAYGARVGGVRMLDGDVTDAVEARSLSLNPQHIDIYSASWGPDDDGKTVDGPGELATRAFIEGVTKGRGGKGSIFIWASGNGGRELDNCNCDGYTNSIWTLSISSATEEGHVPWYSEKCSSTLAATYSSGGQNEKQVVTTDLHHSCTTSHTGTSASAPLAAGIVALVLEANGNLTWRDLQHIVVRTAKPGNLIDQTWTKNGVGRRISHSFGYGLMDAAAMVKMARSWQTVPEQQRCEINAPHLEHMIPAKRYITLQLDVQHCMGVNFLEHVQAKISLTSQRRGDIVIYLQSPAGTRVTLLTSRVHDVSRSGFNEWPFMSVHTWGEAPHGKWLLEVHNEGRFLGYAVLKTWSLIFYGTAIPVDKNDPMPIKPTAIIPSFSSPPTSLHHHTLYSPSNMNRYPVSVLTKPNSKAKTNQSPSSINGNTAAGAGNRKQQQNHKISPYGAILTTPKKNNKNSKNHSTSNNNAKSNSKLNAAASNRPANVQTSSGQQSSKNNLYRLPTSAATNSRVSTGNMRPSSSTVRPKFASQQYQQVAVATYNANTGSSRGSTSGSAAYKPEKVRIQDKIAVKAPKQIKDNNAYGFVSTTTTVNPMPHGTPTQTRYEPNPRIPKLFQQYDKIEQIFPEFHPYTGGGGAGPGFSREGLPPTKPAPNKKQYPYYPNAGSIFQDRNTNGGNRGGGRSNAGGGGGETAAIVVTNPKPSRENSKKLSPTSSSSLPSMSHSSSSSLSFVSSSSSSLQNFPNEQRDKQTDDMYIPNRKNTKAQITQWDIIFYGTDKPPQPDDPIQIRPGPFGPYEGDIDNNFLDTDPETMGQWRDMQQVGESHVDVQRTTKDQTNSACTTFIADQRCIECTPETYLYKERCWSHCPEQTYLIPEVPRSRNRNMNLYSNRTNSDIVPRKRAVMPLLPTKKCAPCHPSCLSCRGPEAFHCLQCHPGNHLTMVSADETYCYPATNGNNLSRATGRLSPNESPEDGTLMQDLNAFWSIVVPSITVIVLVLGLTVAGRYLIAKWRNDGSHSYEKVAFDATNEDLEVLTDGQQRLSSRTMPGTSGTQDQRRILVETSSDSDEY